MTAISKSTPVAVQVETLLRERILQGIYAPGERVPSEEHLAEKLEVSRGTVRTALAALAATGYVVRRHGDGTFVRLDVFELRLNSGAGWEIERQIQQSGFQPNLQILEQIVRPATPEEAAHLQLDADEAVMIIRRLFLAGENPVAIVTSKIRAIGLRPEIPPDAARLSPLEFIERFHMCKSCRGQTHFYASLADQEIASRLQLPLGSPVLELDILVFDTTGRPLACGEEVYWGDTGFRMNGTTARS